ncbi:MAG: cytidyltransferase [Lentisphaerae bacterium RIFOXYA12_FULL_48_11]|nr:MAG: cytidyltransferase [Lentisphaerae bacterium RIFOXYA12_FULL_48_11]
MHVIAMIPARMGSQRLKQKNLQLLGGIPLITRAIRKCRDTGSFNEIWVNSEHPRFGEIATDEGVQFHQRPEALGNNQATSEQFVLEFLDKHTCDYLVQVHSIAPLLTAGQTRDFTRFVIDGGFDTGLSVVLEQIECAMGGKPMNFTFDRKTNSQELEPIQRITWSISAWRSITYKEAAHAGRCSTYSGKVGFFPIDRAAGHIIKTEDDLRMAESLLAMKSHP